MTELGLLLVALYLFEGLSWVSLGTLVSSRRPWGGLATRRPWAVRPGSRSGLLAPEPWAPALERFPAHAWPLALSPHGIAPPGNTSRLGWSDARQIRASGSRLEHAGRVLADAGSPRAARLCVALVHRLADRAPEQRAADIREALAWTFDARRARGRLRRLHPFLWRGRWLAWGITLNLLVLGPLLASVFGLPRAWKPWLGLHLALAALSVALLRRVCQRLPDCGPEAPWETGTTFALYPPATARCMEPLFRNAFTGCDPLAVVAALGARDELARLARERLIEIDSAEAGEVHGWFGAEVRREVESLARRAGLSLREAPALEPGARAYCPRCGAQYRTQIETCVDCADVVLVSRDET